MSEQTGAAVTSAAAPDRAELVALMAMIHALSPLGHAELERALRLQLTPEFDVVAERVNDLGAVSELLAREATGDVDPDAWPGVPTISRGRFQELHGRAHADRLLDRYGSWLSVCRAAYGLRPDGRHHGPGRPWATRLKVRDPHFRWSHDACMSYVRRCARDLGRLPTVTDYRRWVRELVRTPGRQHMRVPWPASILKYAKTRSWPDAVARCGVTADELAEIRAGRLPSVAPAPRTVAQRLSELDEFERQALGLTATQARALRGMKARRALTLEAGISLARGLGGSLEWLADRREDPGSPPDEGLHLAPARVKDQREQRGVSEKNVREAAGLALGDWRKLMSGRTEPILGALLGMSGALRCPMEELLEGCPDD